MNMMRAVEQRERLDERLDEFVGKAILDESSDEAAWIHDIVSDHAFTDMLELMANPIPISVTAGNYKEKLTVHTQDMFMRDALRLFTKINNVLIEKRESNGL